MKSLSRQNLFIALALLLSVQGSVMASNTSAQTLRDLDGQDHFAADHSGLYTGVSSQALKSELNAKVDAAAQALAAAADDKAKTPTFLAIIKEHLADIDRDALDTEDAEHVAGLFEQMLDALGIESSEGILNDWMYGFGSA